MPAGRWFSFHRVVVNRSNFFRMNKLEKEIAFIHRRVVLLNESTTGTFATRTGKWLAH